MKIERSLIEDPHVYEIMYFSPIEIGDERFTYQLYFQTDIYNRTWPTTMADRMTAQIDGLRHAELNILPFDTEFKTKHREAVLFHCKMALAYLDAREARIAMKLCKHAEPATRSTESRILQDPEAEFDFLRITLLSVLACAARRVKFFQVAVDALTEAKDICFGRGSDHNRVHPLMIALTLLNLSAVLGDIDHDEHGLRWGLEALTMMYQIFEEGNYPATVEKYYLVLACHNAALLNVKLGRWDAAVELVDEGIDFTKAFHEVDDGLRRKLIAIGAQAKHVPEGFFEEAVNALNGWGEGCDVWNLSFWDFSAGEIREEIRVLQHTSTLRQIIMDHFDEDRRYSNETEDALLAQFILAVVSCQSLERLTIASLEFDPRKVWRRIKKRSFLETSWYASALNFTNILENAQKPEIAMFKELLKSLNSFLKKVVYCLVVLGNECEGVDLSENGIDIRSISALVRALRWRRRPKFTRQVSTVILRSNALDAETTRELARMWDPLNEEEQLQEQYATDPDAVGKSTRTSTLVAALGGTMGGIGDSAEGNALQEEETVIEPGVTHLDVSYNSNVGDQGLDLLTAGIAKFKPFKVLRADQVGLQTRGCFALERLSATVIELLCISNNAIGSEGAGVVCRAALGCHHLHTLEMDNCAIDTKAAADLSELMEKHGALRNISLNNNDLQSEGIVEFCRGCAESACLSSVHLAYNNITSDAATEAVGDMMRKCETLLEMNLSGNHINPGGALYIGSAIEHSRILTMFLEDMGFTEGTIDEFLDHGAAETQDLQVMILNNNPVGDEGLGIIAECLSIGLTDLSLSNCALTKSSQATLLNLVSLSPNLRSLDLSYNCLGPNGCSDMVMWMTQNEKDNYSLRSFELAGCSLGDEGFYQLVPVLGSVTYVGVRENGITSAGLEAVMNSHQMIQLKCLDLAKNNIGEQGVHALTERFQQEHKRSLWNPKQLTSTIDQVILTDNADITPGLAASTEAFLKIHNPLLSVVW